MINRNILLSIFFICTLFASHTYPASTSGNIGSETLKILNQQSYFLTFPIIPIMYTYLQNHYSQSSSGLMHFAVSMATWYLSGSFLKLTTKIIMDECTIDPNQY